MNKLVECYITRNYYQLLKIAKNITKQDELHQDLLHEVIIQLYDKDKITLKSYDDNSIRYYITAIIRINWYSKTSPFYYKMKKERRLYVDLSECFNMEADQEVYEREQLFELLEQQYCELDWFKKSLLDLYLTLNSLKAVSKQTNIPLTSISNYIKQGKAEIKNNVLKKLNQ